MEVLRERPAAQHTSSPSPAEFDLELPPPPAPFPVDLLEPPAPPIEIPLAATSGAAVAHRNLLSVQTSCVAAITALLPSGDNATQTTSLSPADSRLAAALTDLLEITYELDGLEISPAYQEAEADTDPAGVQINGQVHGAGQSTGEQRERDDFAVLAEHLDALAGGGGADDLDGRLTIGDLRERLLWERVRTLSNIVQVLIQTRSSETQTNDEGQKGREAASKRDQGEEEPDSSVSNGYHRISTDAHPPDYHDQQSLPSYRPRASCSSADEKDEKADLDFDESLPLRSCNVPISEEKKMRELDDLTSAIEQLGQAAPRYDDQRSELRPRSRQAESESAGQQSVSRTSQKERMKELEEIWQRIERAHGKRRMRDQDAEMHLVGNRRKEQREQYLQDLYDRAEASRMSNQDASFREVDSELEKAKLLRQRGKFLQDLIESSANSRLTNQDASSPAERRQEYVSDLVERSEASRMASQDYPLSAAERMRDRKDNFMDSLIEYSSSGRFVGQDSEPPTPRIRDSPVTVQRKSPYDLVTAEDFLKNLPPAPLDGTNGYGKASENPKRRSTSEFPQNGDGKDKDKTGTLRRIRGMVKTKSISLGLSKGPVDDAFSYIAEYQENLNSVAFMLHGPGLPISSDITLSTGSAPVSGTTDATLKLGSSTTNIRLPTAVRPGQSVTLTASTGTHIHLEAKLSAMPSISTPSMLGTKYPLSAADLRQLAPTSICCADCDRIVASLSPTKASQTWKDLPSEHWAEMIEIWMCHQDPTWTSKLAKHTEEGFWPGQGGLLVGGSYLLVNRDDARRANMVYSDGKDPAWNSLTCLCGEPLGKARTEDSRPGAGTVRLAKWAVALLREDDECGENVEPIRTPLGVFMTADMLELAQAHASYRFVVRDEETDEKRILIWLFNPSISISYRQSQTSPLPSPLRQAFSTPSYQPQRASGGSTTSRRSSIASSKSLVRSPSYNTRDSAESSGIRSQTSSGGGSVGSTQMIRVCKIMYHVMEKGEQFRPPGFGPPPGVDQPNVPQAQLQVEDLRYPGMVCDRLVRALKDSTGVYPVGGRRMGVWDVGFLQRE